jgi:hypothetical protein|nr:MAG TPA: hypothetical protein [Caudoviricetes sp.]
MIPKRADLVFYVKLWNVLFWLSVASSSFLGLIAIAPAVYSLYRKGQAVQDLADFDDIMGG